MRRAGRARACSAGAGYNSNWLGAVRAARVAFLLALVGGLAGCAGSGGASKPSFYRTASNGDMRPSPRLPGARDGVTLPKGGGVYKVGSPYVVDGQRYIPREETSYDRSGIASWYGEDFHGRRTANGEIYDMNALTAAHPTLPLPSYAYVTSLESNRTVLVRVNDRGPFVAGRVIDLSRRTAQALGLHRTGTGRVRVRYAGPAPLDGDETRETRFLASQPWSRGSSRVAALPAPAWPKAQLAGEWSATTYRAGRQTH